MPAYYPTSASQAIDLDIDLSTVTEASYDPIPPGEYQAQALNVDVARSQAGNLMVRAEFAIVGGQYDNKRIFENYSIQHANAQVVEIALRAIKSWAIACGHTGNERLTEGLLKSLEGQEFIARISIEKDKTGQYPDKNRLRGCKPLPGSAPQHPATQRPAPAQQVQQPAPPPRQVAAPTGASKRPWEK